MEAEALAERLRSQLVTLRDAQSRQQRSSQERLAALQAHLQSLASRVVRINRLCIFRCPQHCSTVSLTGHASVSEVVCEVMADCVAFVV